MNYRDPELILVKQFRGDKRIYFQVKSHDQSTVILQDIEHGNTFSFKRSQLENHIRNSVLTVSDKSQVPIAEFAYTIAKKVKLVRADTAKNAQEIERRYRYVKRVLDSDLPFLSEQRLKPWIAKVATEFEDQSPPSYKTLGRWVKAFNESGWKKKSLVPAHSSKGNSPQRLEQEVEEILTQVVTEHSTKSVRINATKAHADFVERINLLNQERSHKGLAPLKASCYETTRMRFRG